MKWRALFLIWLLQLVNYLDRINLSIAAPTMMRDLHIEPGLFGAVLSAFTVGYAIMQIPGGRLADRFGSRALLTASPFFWSILTAVTGFAGSTTSLIAVRTLFGMAEGSSNGASFKVVGDWFGSKDRSTANSVYLSALALGPAFVAPLAVWMLSAVGWRAMFFWFSLPGLGMAALVWAYMPRKTDAPSAVAQSGEAARPSSFRDIVSSRSSWALFVAYMAFNVAFWGYLGWMPSYLSLERHVDLRDLGTAAAIPYVFGFVGMLVIGWLGSRPMYRLRAVLVAVAYALAALSLVATFEAETVNQSVAGLSAAAFFLYGGFGPVWAIILDITPPEARASFSGFVNCGGQIGGAVAPVVIGTIVQVTHSFGGGFLFMVGGLAVSAAAFLTLHPVLQQRATAGQAEWGRPAVPAR